MTFTEKPFFSLALDCEISAVRAGASSAALCAQQTKSSVPRRTGPPEEKKIYEKLKLNLLNAKTGQHARPQCVCVFKKRREKKECE